MGGSLACPLSPTMGEMSMVGAFESWKIAVVTIWSPDNTDDESSVRTQYVG